LVQEERSAGILEIRESWMGPIARISDGFFAKGARCSKNQAIPVIFALPENDARFGVEPGAITGNAEQTENPHACVIPDAITDSRAFGQSGIRHRRRDADSAAIVAHFVSLRNNFTVPSQPLFFRTILFRLSKVLYAKNTFKKQPYSTCCTYCGGA
jgi:hypothetical protein